MKSLKVLAVDDEYLALELIETFLNRMGTEWQLIGKLGSPIEAQKCLLEESIDLLFLDIQMPSMLGTELLKSLEQKPLTIFTTAYADYAQEAFDLDVVDYLLKPFSFERFEHACQKAKAALQLRQFQKAKEKPHLIIKVESRMQKVYFEDILYIEGMREYVRIVCKDQQKHLTLESLWQLESLLPTEQFIRVHKSYIVAHNAVIAAEGYTLSMFDGTKIPISRSKREMVVNRLFG